METKVICQPTMIPEAAEAVRKGSLVAVPTETVYGLCVNGLDSRAVAELYEIKGRPEIKPLSLMIPSPDHMDKYAREVPGAARALANRFWPGPLTIILPARTDVVPSIVRADGDTIGLRCPDHPMTLSLLFQCGVPLAGPSANPSGKPSPLTAEEVLAYFDGQIPWVLDGGRCGLGRESTILDMSTLPYRILRQGALDRDAISHALTDNLRLIGVTGGTGSGKTTVLQYLTDRGALGLDCDEIYHRLLLENEPMLAELRERFPGAFTVNGLDRKRLGALVFSDPEALEGLNQITHRYVAQEVHRRLEEFAWAGGSVAVIDAIALLESGLGELCDLTVGVIADKDTRVKRIMIREGISEEYARSRVDAQKNDAFFIARCHRVLRNDGTQAELEEQCRKLFGEEIH